MAKGKNIYFMDNNGIHFSGNNELKAQILNVRAEFIHLSAYDSGWTTFYAHDATSNNKRIIIYDNQ